MRNAWQVARDPFATSAELVQFARPMSPARFAAFVATPPADWPTLVAARGFKPWPGWGRFYYRAPDGWRDTETDEPAQAPPQKSASRPIVKFNGVRHDQ